MQWSLSMRTFNASSAAWSIFSFQTHYSHPNFMIFFFYSLFLRIAQYPTRLCCFNGLIILGLDYWALTFRSQFWSFFHRLIDCSLIQASLGCLAIADPTLAQEAAKILRLAHRLAKCKWSLFILDFLPHYFKHGESLAVESGIGPSGKSTFQSFFIRSGRVLVVSARPQSGRSQELRSVAAQRPGPGQVSQVRPLGELALRQQTGTLDSDVE